MPSILDNFPLGFFDGAHKDGWCGVGVILHLRRNHFFRLSTGLGHVTNTFVELMALWGILWFSRKRGILELRVVGDSKDVIDWENGKNSMRSLNLSHWMKRVQMVIQHFASISFSHIYRNFNWRNAWFYSLFRNFWMKNLLTLVLIMYFKV